MNELARSVAQRVLQDDPALQGVFDDVESQQAELFHLLDLMGVRHVVVELPPAANAEVLLRANVSSTSR